MATTNSRVMNMVRAELDANPGVKTKELFEKAKRMEPSLSTLSVRQFHARYPLQIKRQRAPKKPRAARQSRKPARQAKPAAAEESSGRRGRRAKSSGSNRDEVRSVLLKFAGEIAGADSKVDVVKVIGEIDTYVERVITAAG